MVEVGVDTFQKEVLEERGRLVIVDFWADWCMPCKMIEPILEELEKEYNDKIKICRVNVDEEPQLASQYQILSIPTLLFIKDGQILHKIIGASPKHLIKTAIDNFL